MTTTAVNNMDTCRIEVDGISYSESEYGAFLKERVVIPIMNEGDFVKEYINKLTDLSNFPSKQEMVDHYSSYREKKRAEQMDLDIKWRTDAIHQLKDAQKANFETKMNQMSNPTGFLVPEDIHCGKFFDEDKKLLEPSGYPNKTELETIAYAALQNNCYLMRKVEKLEKIVNDLVNEVKILRDENKNISHNGKFCEFCCNDIISNDMKLWQDIYNKELKSDNGEFFRRANESKAGFILNYLYQDNNLTYLFSYPNIQKAMHEYGFRVKQDKVIPSFRSLQNTNDIHYFLKYYQDSINIKDFILRDYKPCLTFTEMLKNYKDRQSILDYVNKIEETQKKIIMEQKCERCKGSGFEYNYRCSWCGIKIKDSYETGMQRYQRERIEAEYKWGTEFRQAIQQTPINN